MLKLDFFTFNLLSWSGEVQAQQTTDQGQNKITSSLQIPPLVTMNTAGDERKDLQQCNAYKC